MNLKYFHDVELLHNSFVAMVTLFQQQQGRPAIHFSRGAIVPNMHFKYSPKPESFGSLLVVMGTMFPWQQGYLLICIVLKTFAPNMSFKYFDFFKLLSISFI